MSISLNIFSPGSSFSISWKYILNGSFITANDIFRNDILSFIPSLKPLLSLKGDQYLKKSYFCWWKLFSLNFSDTDSNGSSLVVHLNRIFQLILHSGWWKRFLVNYKPFAFIQIFFLPVATIHEIKCRPIFQEKLYSCSLKPFSLIFADIPASGSSFFPASGNGVFIKSFIATSAYGYWVNFKLCPFIQRAFFLLLESITEIRSKTPFFTFLSS